MRIAKVSVDGYRLLNGFELDLRDNLSLVIGKNNTGKTSLLNALSAFLSRAAPAFSYEDFSIAAQRSLFSALESAQDSGTPTPLRIKLELSILYDEQDNLRNLSKLMVDLSPEARAVNLRFQSEVLRDDFERLHEDTHANIAAIEKAIARSLTGAERRDEIQRFLSKNLRSYLTSSTASFDPMDAMATLDLTKDRALVLRVLKLESVSARRSVENRNSGKGGKASGRALSQLSSDYFDDHTGGNENRSTFIQLATQAAVADREFTKAYKEVFEDVLKKVKRFGAVAGLSGDIQVTSSIQPAALLNDSTSVKYGDIDTLLPEDYNGLGYLNLIAIIMEIEIRLMRMKSDTDSGPSDINLLVIEEPEAHTHPQLQYIFIKQIKELLNEHKTNGSLQLQTVITTHSSHITAESDFADIKYFRRVEDRVEALNMTDLESKYAEDKKAYHFLTQYLTLTRAELFFADKAVLIEGDTERILMRAMMRKIDDADPEHRMPLSTQNISVVEVGAHSQVFDHFIEFTGLKSLIITDIDSSKIVERDGTRSAESCPVADGTHTSNEALKHFLSLEESGLEDRGDLESLRGRAREDKMLVKHEGAWRVAENNAILFLCYQTEENEYEARSYEDAFIHVNRAFIERNLASFRGLKNRKQFSDPSKNSFDLAQNCVAKKTHFALDVIYSQGDFIGEPWRIPAYIDEGLRWLRDAS